VSSDAFITAINATGSALVYSTYFGGSDTDTGSGVAVDGLGNIYVVGQTASLDLPTANPLQPGASGGLDIFVVKIGSGGGASAVASVSAASFLGSETASEEIIAAFGAKL